MLNIKTIITGDLYTNCYIVSDPLTNECIIIDPADTAYLISEYILQNSLTPTSIIATHGHFDHILAAYELQLAFDIPFMVHKEDVKIVKRMKQSAEYWLKKKIIEKEPSIDNELEDGDVIKLGNIEFKVLHTPGHSPGGICIYSEDEKTVFTGDTLFHNTTGRTDLSYSSPSDMKKSLEKVKEKFSGYKAYAGHDENFIIP
jgi:hydroxyacylglutathione hydrolase